MITVYSLCTTQKLTLLTTLTSAFDLINISTTLSWPCWLAICREVDPLYIQENNSHQCYSTVSYNNDFFQNPNRAFIKNNIFFPSRHVFIVNLLRSMLLRSGAALLHNFKELLMWIMKKGPFSFNSQCDELRFLTSFLY